MKWPVPVLSATRVEWLPKVQSDLFVLQTPVHLSTAHVQTIVNLIQGGHPVAIFGGPVGGIDPAIAEAVGLIGLHAGDGSAVTPRTATASAGVNAFAKNITSTFPMRTLLDINQAVSQVKVLYSVDGSPQLVLNTSQKKKIVAWDPPTFDNSTRDPLITTWGGSVAPYALTAGALNFLIAEPNFLHATEIDANETMNVAAWRTTDGKFHLMAAELEEGLRNDADRSRHTTLALPVSWKIPMLHDEWSGKAYEIHDRKVQINLNHAQSILLTSGH
jgi:hypothetical protein